MATPLIYRRNDEVSNAGTYIKTVDGDGRIELSFTPRSSISIRSAPFNWSKNKLVTEMGLAALWDNTGALKVYMDPEDENKVKDVINLIAWCYSKVLDYDGLSSDEFVELAPGMWMLESDLAVARLDEEGKKKLFKALSEIFTRKPRMFLIATPKLKEERSDFP